MRAAAQRWSQYVNVIKMFSTGFHKGDTYAHSKAAAKVLARGQKTYAGFSEWINTLYRRHFTDT